MSCGAATAKHRSETAVVDGLRLHHWVGGEPAEPPVLLWHAFLPTAYTWRKAVPALADAAQAALVPEPRGHGDSDKPTVTASARDRRETRNGAARAVHQTRHLVARYQDRHNSISPRCRGPRTCRTLDQLRGEPS